MNTKEGARRQARGRRHLPRPGRAAGPHAAVLQSAGSQRTAVSVHGVATVNHWSPGGQETCSAPGGGSAPGGQASPWFPVLRALLATPACFFPS